MRISQLFLLLCLIAAPAYAQSAHSQQDTTAFTLVTKNSAIVPGQPIEAGVLIEAKEGWHTYWENPGDAGMPTQLTWNLPPGFKASPIDWPTPTHMVEGPLVTYSYPGRVFLPVTITPPRILDATLSYPLSVKVEVLVCKDICIPESAQLQLSLPVGNSAVAATPYAHLFEEHEAKRPQPLGAPASFTADEHHLTLLIPLEALPSSDITSASFFMREPNLINYAAMQQFSLGKNALQLSVERTDAPLADSISGIVSITSKNGDTNAYDVTFVTQDTVAQDAQPVWFPTVLLLAVLGGLVLNLMPCVLPILSLKALAVAKKSASAHEHVVRHGVAYTLGIMLSFAIIAGLLLALRSAGEAIGWGYQMQSPAFVGFLMYLLFLVGLNLSGVFELPVLLGGVNARAHEASVRSSFFTGVLAAAVATPCTAPFMASAVGAALTLPALQALLIFEALGFGLALPFLLISLFPRLRAMLPKPGAWMERFKQFLAFPMYGSVIWLMWVLTLQTGAGGTVLALMGMLAIIFVLWLKSWFESGSRAYAVLAIIAYALIAAVTLPMLATMEIATPAMPGGHAMQEIDTVDYTREKLAQLQGSRTPVLVDATAAWCITCQVNARIAIHTPRVMAAFKDKGITLMIADWTRRNDEITQYLRSFGYSGVPLVVFYPARGEPVVLPQILTEAIVLAALEKGN